MSAPGGGNPNPKDFRQRFNELFTRMELMGVKAANKLHRGFINLIFLFLFWNIYVFTRNYNNYWRLRRDPNIPRQWLEEQQRPGSEDWAIERERMERDQRLVNQDRRKFYE
jgi:hypothetical protein